MSVSTPSRKRKFSELYGKEEESQKTQNQSPAKKARNIVSKKKATSSEEDEKSQYGQCKKILLSFCALEDISQLILSFLIYPRLYYSQHHFESKKAGYFDIPVFRQNGSILTHIHGRIPLFELCERLHIPPKARWKEPRFPKNKYNYASLLGDTSMTPPEQVHSNVLEASDVVIRGECFVVSKGRIIIRGEIVTSDPNSNRQIILLTWMNQHFQVSSLPTNWRYTAPSDDFFKVIESYDDNIYALCKETIFEMNLKAFTQDLVLKKCSNASSSSSTETMESTSFPLLTSIYDEKEDGLRMIYRESAAKASICLLDAKDISFIFNVNPGSKYWVFAHNPSRPEDNSVIPFTLRFVNAYTLEEEYSLSLGEALGFSAYPSWNFQAFFVDIQHQTIVCLVQMSSEYYLYNLDGKGKVLHKKRMHDSFSAFHLFHLHNGAESWIVGLYSPVEYCCSLETFHKGTLEPTKMKSLGHGLAHANKAGFLTFPTAHFDHSGLNVPNHHFFFA